jgi:hypothetical protein
MARDAEHARAWRAARKTFVPGVTVCCRCGGVIYGTTFDLDHVDQPWVAGGAGRRLPAHPRCNRSAGGRLGASRRQAKRRNRMTTITVWPALGLEVSPDRGRTWVARAAVNETGQVVVDLLDPIPGTAGVPEFVAEAWMQWGVESVGIDPRSPSATLVEPLRHEGVLLREADAVGMAVAHGKLLDILAVERLRIRGNRALDDAARQAQERRLAGASAVDRYLGADQAPLVAAELAVWCLDIDNPDGATASVWLI